MTAVLERFQILTMISYKNLHRQIGHNVFRHRIHKCETQAALAKFMGVTRPVVSNMEAGRRPVTVRELYILARHFQVSIVPELIPAADRAPQATALERSAR